MTNKKVAIIILLLILAFSSLGISRVSGTWTFSDSSQTIGFSNGGSVGFASAMTFITSVDGGATEQLPSTNASYPSFMFFQQQGSTSVYGFWTSGCNITIINYFTSNILQFTVDGAGTVKVYVGGLGAPALVTGATGIYDSSSSVAILTVSVAGTVEVSWINPGPGPNPSSGPGGPTPTPTSSSSPLPYPTPKPLGDVDFQIDPVNLGKVYPNTTVTSNLHFRYSGSSYILQLISLTTPFKTWYVNNGNISQYVYILSNNATSTGDKTLTFHVPGYLVAQLYTGTITVLALDSFGQTHSSSAAISADLNGDSHGFDWMKNLWLLLLFLLIIILLLIATYYASKRRRRRYSY